MTETRSHVLFRHVEQFVRNSGSSWESFVDDVVAEFHRRIPRHLREVRFVEDGDAVKRLRANCDKFRDFRDGKARLPVDLEEAVVFALPPERRERLLQELAGRYGLMAAPLPIAGQGAYDFGRLAKEFGEAVQVIAEMLDDGVIDAKDRPLAQRAIRELTDVIEQATGFIRRANELLGCEAPQVRAVK